jgi:hypothetical protein
MMCVVGAFLIAAAWSTTVFAQTGAPATAWQPPPAQNGPMPTVAFDITKADIDYVLKNAPPNPPDRQLRVVDMGKYNLGVGIIQPAARPTTNPGDRSHGHLLATPRRRCPSSRSGSRCSPPAASSKERARQHRLRANVMAGAERWRHGRLAAPTAASSEEARLHHHHSDVVAHGWENQITDHVTRI